jgi:hypothetical protein
MAKILQNLKENMDSRKTKPSPEDVRTVRQVADEANAAQGDRYPEAYEVIVCEQPTSLNYRYVVALCTG